MSAVLNSFRLKPAAVIPSLLILSIVAPIASLGDFGQIASEIVYLNGSVASTSQRSTAEYERNWKKALELRTWRAAPDARYSIMANRLAIFLEDQGRYADAESFYKEAIRVSDKTLGRRHAATSVIMVNLAILYCRTGKFVEAEHLLNQAMYIQLKKFGKVHTLISHTSKAMGLLHEYKGEYSKAKVFYVQALEIRKGNLAADNPKIANSSIDLSRIYVHEGRAAEAELLVRDAARIGEKVIGHNDPESVLLRKRLAIRQQTSVPNIGTPSFR